MFIIKYGTDGLSKIRYTFCDFQNSADKFHFYEKTIKQLICPQNEFHGIYFNLFKPSVNLQKAVILNNLSYVLTDPSAGNFPMITVDSKCTGNYSQKYTYSPNDEGPMEVQLCRIRNPPANGSCG